ncbi:metallophosphoesterase family protein [Hymenobacter algoricola]|uniref:Calcineurin-like phosphoesterase domain-containing protein n=1 Tax=Hymenobacter algoricola TaxID=486267 RepID=A0ABP7NLD5_9BACT
MTIAFFSDVHGNLPALEAVLADMDQRRPDLIFCLGDLVGYAPRPNEVVKEVRRRGIPTLAGNYDQRIGLASSNCGCAYKTPPREGPGRAEHCLHQPRGGRRRAALPALAAQAHAAGVSGRALHPEPADGARLAAQNQ